MNLSAPVDAQPANLDRNNALDALRGAAVLLFFATTSGARCVFALPQSPPLDVLRVQLRPSPWHGVTVADLCYPAFLFVAGVSLALSFERRASAVRKNASFRWRSLQRAAVLFVVGWLVENVGRSTEGVRWTGPLPQLAVCIAIGGGTAVFLRTWRSAAALAAGSLLTYGLVLASWPVSSPDRDSFDRNAAAAVDGRLLPGVGYFGEWDPHGILTTIPATAILLGGLAAGRRAQHHETTESLRIAVNAGAGLIAVNLAVITQRIQPANPHLGTPAYALAAIGGVLLTFGGLMSCERFAAIHRCLWPLRVLGRNSLLSVIVISAAPLRTVSDSLIDGDIAAILAGLAPVAKLLVEFAAVCLPAWFLFRRGIFLTP